MQMGGANIGFRARLLEKGKGVDAKVLARQGSLSSVKRDSRQGGTEEKKKSGLK